VQGEDTSRWEQRRPTIVKVNGKRVVCDATFKTLADVTTGRIHPIQCNRTSINRQPQRAIDSGGAINAD